MSLRIRARISSNGIGTSAAATGIVVAGGTSDHEALVFYTVFAAVALAPAVIAVTAIARRTTR
jgi:hypothetical protein